VSISLPGEAGAKEGSNGLKPCYILSTKLEAMSTSICTHMYFII
jgi:hypothetical protein